VDGKGLLAECQNRTDRPSPTQLIKGGVAGPVFILASEIEPTAACWTKAEEQASRLASFATRLLGFSASARLAVLPTRPADDQHHLAKMIEREISEGASEVFVLPLVFELNIWQRQLLGQTLSEIRRIHQAVSIHHDDINPSHPLLVDCFTDKILQALDAQGIPPRQAGILLVAIGQGDPGSRADSYRLMRLLWEQTGLGFGDVGFVGHEQPFLPAALQRCQREPLNWLLLPQCQWASELYHHAKLILADHQRANPTTRDWQFLEPVSDHPMVLAWLEHRVRQLWQEKRARQAIRIPSPIHENEPSSAEVWADGSWGSPDRERRTAFLARARDANALADILSRVLPPAECYLIKVTWHGYATGTYTDPLALDWLLRALPGRAILLEGHTSSRNLGGADWDWETQTREHRTWIREQELEFLKRTGLAQVIAQHGAQYLNVTEAWWDGACAPEEEIRAALGRVSLRHPELAGFVPSVLLPHRGIPLISFARFKGATRLGISNLFGLLPQPLRSAWHGPNITYFASVCCDLARLYGSLFPLFGLVEAFAWAVRWDRKGLYRSRWGNYDLVPGDGIFTFSEGLVGADLLASRVQGQDVHRSGFYDVVRERLGWSQPAAEMPLPAELQARLA
jgi:sirohydrochlorin ferrochelatase